MDTSSSKLKERGTIELFHWHSDEKPASLMIGACISTHQGCTSGKAPSMLPYTWTSFLREDFTYIWSKTIIKCILHLLQQHGFIIEEVLNWPACSLDLSPTENFSKIMKWKIGHRQEDTGMTRMEQHFSPKSSAAALLSFLSWVDMFSMFYCELTMGLLVIFQSVFVYSLHRVPTFLELGL